MKSDEEEEEKFPSKISLLLELDFSTEYCIIQIEMWLVLCDRWRREDRKDKQFHM